MKQRRVPFARIALLLAAAVVSLGALLWIAIAPHGSAVQVEQPPLAGAPIGGDFSLTDQDGNRVSNDSLQGRYRLVYFGYSFCPDVCPVDVQRMMAAFRSFEVADPEAAATLQPIFVTIDPARDTRQALKTFVSAFHPRLIGLTGSEAEIALAKRAYRVYAAKADGSDSENYLMDHSAYIYLMDKTGKPIAFFDRGDTADAIAAGIEKWVR